MGSGATAYDRKRSSGKPFQAYNVFHASTPFSLNATLNSRLTRREPLKAEGPLVVRPV
jgi:hypothetical protein